MEKIMIEDDWFIQNLKIFFFAGVVSYSAMKKIFLYWQVPGLVTGGIFLLV